MSENLSGSQRLWLVYVSVALAICGATHLLFEHVPLFRRMELNSLDDRYKRRGSIIEREDLATIDIDAATISQSGSWPISRRLYAEMLRALSTYDAKLMSFDVFFPDKSPVEIDERSLSHAQALLADGDSEGLAEQLKQMSRNADRDFADAMKETGLGVLAQTFSLAVPEVLVDREKLAGELRERSDAMKSTHVKSADIGRQFSVVCDEEAERSILWARAIGVEPPAPLLMEAARALGFAQVLQDLDGVVRRYPTFIHYDGRLYPSLGLMSSCVAMGVELDQLEVVPGSHVRIPGTEGRADLEIPVDRHLRMLVNWAGDYADTFTHVPASIILEFRAIDAVRGVLQKYRGDDAGLIENGYSEAEAEVMGRYLLAEDDEGSLLKVRDLLVAALVENSLARKETRQEFLNVYVEGEDGESLDLFGGIWDQVSANRALIQDVSLSTKGHNADFCRFLLAGERDVDEWWPLYFFPPIEYSLTASATETAISPLDLTGKVFFIGLTAPGTHDYGATPFSSVYPMVGLHVNVANTIMSGQFLYRIPGWAGFLISILIVMPVVVAATRNHPVLGAAAIAALFALYVVVVGGAFSSFRLCLPAMQPVASGVLVYLVVAIHRYLAERQEKNRVHAVFSTYMTPSVVDEVLKNPSMLKLGGQRRDMTVFFSDLVGFTSISERCTPEELVALLNDYLSHMTDIIFRHGGTLDKYEGDGIMAFWNAPLEQKDHVYLCCSAALDCLEFLEKEMCPRLLQAGKPELSVRIGVNTGPMIVGNMGSGARMDYTVMGDAVNLGARLEAANKAYGTRVMISERTYRELGDRMICRFLDNLRVKGKREPVAVYEVVAHAGQVGEEQSTLLSLYEEAMVKYKAREWDGALALFERALSVAGDDGPCKTYVARCREYSANPPPTDWDGVWVLTSK